MPDQTLSTHVETPTFFGPVFFDHQERSLSGAGRTIRLEPRLAELLSYLGRRAGDTVSRGELIDTIWGDEGSDEALTQAVARLRRALKDLGGDGDAIETLPKVGYRMRLRLADASPRHLASANAEVRRLSPFATHAMAFGAGFVLMALIAIVWFAIALRPVTVERQIIHDPRPPVLTN